MGLVRIVGLVDGIPVLIVSVILLVCFGVCLWVGVRYLP